MSSRIRAAAVASAPEAGPASLSMLDGQLRWVEDGLTRTLPRTDLKRAFIEVQPHALEIWALRRDGAEVRLFSAPPDSPEAGLDRLRAWLAGQDLRPELRVARGPGCDAPLLPDWFRDANALARGAALPPGARFIPNRPGWVMELVPPAIFGAAIVLVGWRGSQLASNPGGLPDIGIELVGLVFMVGLAASGDKLRMGRFGRWLPRRFNNGTYLLPEGVLVVARGVMQRFIPIADVRGVNLEHELPPSIRFRTDAGEQALGFDVPRRRWTEVRSALRTWDAQRSITSAA